MRHFILLPIIVFSALTAKAQLVINEVMQSNIDCIMDDLNDFPDSWVEIYNPGDAPVDLKDYALSLSNDAETAFKLPSKTIAAKGYELVYCDKVGEGMHTDFRLESGKDGNIFLFDPSGAVIDSYKKMKKQPAPNISYGRETDGGDSFGYMLTPTPKAENKGGVVDNKAILGDPVFETPGHVYNKNTRMSVAISIPEGAPEGTVIRYTTDGSEPTVKSTLYTKAFTIAQSSIVRAKLFCEGYLSPRSVTQSYIMLGREQTLPVVSLVTNDEYFYDNKIGIYVGNENDENSNFFQDWRRPVNIEYFPSKNEDAVINQLGETRIQGGYTRRFARKSLAVYANKRFGEKRLSYEFFPETKPGLTEFKSIILRNAGNDFDGTYFRDAAIQTLAAQHCDLDWQAYQPAIVYLNGKYLGMLNIRERSNEDNIYTNYDGLEDIDMIENWQELKTGDTEEFDKFKAFYTAAANAENTNMDNYAQMMDIDEYLNMMAVNIYIANTDFPGNNIVQWRPKTEDGKWRWLIKDTDFGLGLYGKSSEYKYLDWLYNSSMDPGSNKAEDTRLFRRLMADERFKDLLIDRLTVFMGTFLNKASFTEIINKMNSAIKTEYAYHRSQINQWWNPQQQEVENAKAWAGRRDNFMPTYIKSYFNIPGTLRSLVVEKEVKGTSMADYKITLNDTWLTDGLFTGKMYSGREVRMNATPLNEETPEIYGWRIITIDNKGQQEQTSRIGSKCTLTMPSDKDVVKISPILTNPNGIDEVEAEAAESTGSGRQIYTIDGKRINSTYQSGIYIIKEGNKTKKVMR